LCIPYFSILFFLIFPVLLQGCTASSCLTVATPPLPAAPCRRSPLSVRAWGSGGTSARARSTSPTRTAQSQSTTGNEGRSSQVVMSYCDPQVSEELKWADWEKRSNQSDAGMTRLKETCTCLGTSSNCEERGWSIFGSSLNLCLVLILFGVTYLCRLLNGALAAELPCSC
jgi:hypothetical protein